MPPVRRGEQALRPPARTLPSSVANAPAAHGPDAPPLALLEQLLFSPAEAAALLAVPESWLRRKAGRRLIPCTFLGKHLRFSTADLTAIADRAAQPPRRPCRPAGR